MTLPDYDWTCIEVGCGIAYVSAWMCRIVSLLEDWPRWFGGPMRDRITGLLSGIPRLHKYVRDDYLGKIVQTGHSYILNKLATCEIILRMADNVWDLEKIR